MVTMIPKTREGQPNYSEERIFEAFENIKTRPDWIVIHSLKQRKVTSGYQAETDFIVLVPGKGIVLIEAKGATKALFENGGWTMKGVDKKAKHKDPFDQLEKGASNLKNQLALLDLDHGKIPIARLVWFAKMDQIKFTQDKTSGMAFYPYELAFDSNLRTAIATIEDCLDQTIKTNKSKSDFKTGDNYMTVEVADVIVKKLIGGVSLGQSRNVKAKIRSHSLQQAKLEQELLFDLVAENPRIYFDGPGGSGKSVLLRQAAKNLSKQGKNVLFLTYNLMLEEDTAKSLEDSQLVEVSSINRFLLNCADKPTNPDRASSAWYDVELPKKALAALRDSKTTAPRYDAVIIDEFQDFAGKTLWLRVIEELVHISKKRKPRLILAGDDRQLIGGGQNSNSLEIAEMFFPNLVRVSLKTNVRQAPQLVEEIYRFLEKPNPFRRNLLSETNEGKLEVIQIQAGKTEEKTKDAELKKLADVVFELLEDYEPSSIRVLSPYGEQKSALVRAFSLGDTHSKSVKELKKITKHITNPTGQIRWRSIMKFKGLESDVVIITDINNESKKFVEEKLRMKFEDLLYIGMSRARFHVVLLVQDELFPNNKKMTQEEK